MSGHVSMMNDVLITQLSPALLRSALRFIVSQDHGAVGLLVQHVRKSFRDNPLPRPSPSELFSGSTASLKEYLSSVRCLFSCHMVSESLPYLVHLVESIPQASAFWKAGSELESILVTSSADIIQAVQAIKEAKSHPEDLDRLLLQLYEALMSCNQYCRDTGLDPMYSRAQSQVVDALNLLYPKLVVENGDPNEVAALIVDMSFDKTKVETVCLGKSLCVPRMFNGFWQMSSPAWGSASATKLDEALVNLVQHGLVASDMADHYGDAELVYGSFRNRLPPPVAKSVIAATKWCVFATPSTPPTPASVLAAVTERSKRIGGVVDLLQFHWQDYDNRDFLIIIKWLVELTKSRPDLVANIGLCNFDSLRTREVCEYMIEETGEVGIVSNQVQYSLIDSRPLFAMSEVCLKYDIKLLTYGSFCGGFLSDRWLGLPAPVIYDDAKSLTPSQRKYLDMIYTWGSWQDFIDLLAALRSLADKHKVDISNVATRWVLQRPEVAAVIVGTRLGVSSNVEANLNVFSFTLSEDDISVIEQAALGSDRKKALALMNVVGDCGQEYR